MDLSIRKLRSTGLILFPSPNRLATTPLEFIRHQLVFFYFSPPLRADQQKHHLAIRDSAKAVLLECLHAADLYKIIEAGTPLSEDPEKVAI